MSEIIVSTIASTPVDRWRVSTISIRRSYPSLTKYETAIFYRSEDWSSDIVYEERYGTSDGAEKGHLELI
ncbi:MAG: hypothetical protein QMD85_02985, partial [Candidatus Aenigmarchaeota archaeon]|nr:hypothetical protein [Candidatus Aenigmarchaeota archaeon]MDI6722504.1 hypothetical protein [Candidatus Aenigmarchaeota archaeon]